MEDIFDSNLGSISITKQQVERIVGTKFIDDRQWEIFKYNFFIKFLCVPRHTLPSYFKWTKEEYYEVVSKG
tara:strand:+ start:1033 stop:1245 length:213 start_codon:yes stop_codon:yes gene_type:complete